MDANNNVTGFTYDYFLKDHLGNVRMVLTEEQKTNAYPPASMENVTDKNNLSDPNNYIPYYSNSDYTTNSNLRYPISNISGYPVDNYTSPNNFVSKTNGSAQKIGPAIVLKVMSGDKFNIRVSSWYKKKGVTPGTPINPLSDLIAALNTSIGTVVGSKATTTILQSNNTLNGPATSFYNSHTGDSTTMPKAYVNWILFDEQFNYVASSSGFEQVGTDQQFKVHQFYNLPINKNGYLYVYVSNETPNIDVFFDNLQVTHIRGPILEETHYYPFGLTIAGISSKAVNFGGAENKRKYNSETELQNKEFSDGTGLELYETFYRSLDPQIGKFWQIDPKPKEFESPFAAMGNNPVRYSDILGDTVYSRNKDGDAYIINNTSKALNLKKGQANPLRIAEDGEVTIDKKTYKKLNGAQKAILEPLRGMIDSKKNFGINVVDKDYVILGDNGQVTEDGKTRSATVGDRGGGTTESEKYNKEPELQKPTIEIYLSKDGNSSGVKGITGEKIVDPQFVIQFHEFGHGFYNRVLEYTKNMPCKAVDAENDVRRNTNLPLRAFDPPGTTGGHIEK